MVVIQDAFKNIPGYTGCKVTREVVYRVVVCTNSEMQQAREAVFSRETELMNSGMLDESEYLDVRVLKDS